MTTKRATWSYGQGSPDAAPGFGGYTDVAKALTAMSPDLDVSRQLVYMWWKRRVTTGFPDRQKVKLPSGDTREMFKLEDAENWFRDNRMQIG